MSDIDLDLMHQCWLAGWEGGYAKGSQDACEERVRELQHAEAVRWTNQAVSLAESRHGIAWAEEIRAQSEAVA